jgi:hypothetical protein
VLWWLNNTDSAVIKNFVLGEKNHQTIKTQSSVFSNLKNLVHKFYISTWKFKIEGEHF